MSPLKPVTIHARRGFVVLALLAVPALPIGAWIVSGTVSDTSDQSAATAAQAKRTAALARQTAELARAIQDQRKDSIRSSCRAQNRRHRNTIRALDVLIDRLPPGPRRTRAETNRQGTVFLLNAIVPHQDCAALVAKAAPTPKQPRP